MDVISHEIVLHCGKCNSSVFTEISPNIFKKKDMVKCPVCHKWMKPWIFLHRKYHPENIKVLEQKIKSLKALGDLFATYICLTDFEETYEGGNKI